MWLWQKSWRRRLPPRRIAAVMARSVRRFAAAGLLPSSLLGWELYSYFDKVRASRSETRPEKLVEGSTLWLVEREAQTLDLVFFRRRLGAFGPSALLADYAAQSCGGGDAPYDGVGVIVVERDGSPRVLRAAMDGSVSSTPLWRVLRETEDYAEVLIKPLAWPDRESATSDARKFAGGAVVRCGGGSDGPRMPWDTLKDARLAPLLLPRASWPAPRAAAALRPRVDGAVSPSATLVLELLCSCNVVAPQYRDTAYVPADFAAGTVPLRRGARYASDVMTVKAPNA